MGRHGPEDQPPALAEVRLDVWLDVTCLFPTRAQAAAACAGGKVDLNGRAAAAHRLVRPGDRLAITFARGRRSFLVRGLLERHVKKSEARALFEETTPPPSPEVVEARRLERLLAPRSGERGGARPTKRERRQRERAREW
jgi:ribosome-associated heat shock protein Hsp15